MIILQLHPYLEMCFKIEVIIECIMGVSLILYYLLSFIYKLLNKRKKTPMIMKTKIVSYNMDLVKPCKPFDSKTLPVLPIEMWMKIFDYKYKIENQPENPILYNLRWQAGWRPANWSYTAQIGGDWIKNKNT